MSSGSLDKKQRHFGQKATPFGQKTKVFGQCLAIEQFANLAISHRVLARIIFAQCIFRLQETTRKPLFLSKRLCFLSKRLCFLSQWLCFCPKGFVFCPKGFVFCAKCIWAWISGQPKAWISGQENMSSLATNPCQRAFWIKN